MSEIEATAAPPRPDLLLRLRARLDDLKPPLRVLAESLRGAESPIDFVAADPSGQVVLVLVGGDGECLELLARGLAQKSWAEPRLRDWLQLAPNLGIRADQPCRVLLLCPEFRPETLAAARSLPPGSLALARYRCVRAGAQVHALVETVDNGGADASEGSGRRGESGRESPPALAERRPSQGAPAPPFRTGLTEDDLDLSPAEKAEFE